MRISDWSSDVCSSDLIDRDQRYFERYGTEHRHASPMEPGELAAPLVFELGNIRSLLANWAFVQSAMSIDDPDRLILDYTRRMMGFLLFNPSPRAIKIIGLGGGWLAKCCHRYLPDTSFVSVELDTEVNRKSDVEGKRVPIELDLGGG